MSSHWPYKKLFIIAACLGVVTGVGTLGYHLIEGWDFLDAIYMTVITLATVGYGETHELSQAGRIFTIFLILSGVGVLAYAISNLTAFFVEGELHDALRRSRMQSKINSLKDHYIVCGSGHTRRAILNELRVTGRDVVVIESNEDEFQRLLDEEIPTVLGDPTEDNTLKQAGIERAAGLFTALNSDRDNAFVCLTARGLNPKLKIVAEQLEEGIEDKLLRSGADRVIRSSRIGGLRMVSEMVRPAVVSFLDAMLREGQESFRIEEIAIPEDSPLAGKPLQLIKGMDGNAALVVALKSPKQDSYLLNPPQDHTISPEEVLIVMGTVEQRKELTRKLQLN